MEKRIKIKGAFLHIYMHVHRRGMVQAAQLNMFDVLDFDFATSWT
jgi:hypothetical protein